MDAHERNCFAFPPRETREAPFAVPSAPNATHTLFALPQFLSDARRRSASPLLDASLPQTATVAESHTQTKGRNPIVFPSAMMATAPSEAMDGCDAAHPEGKSHNNLSSSGNNNGRPRSTGGQQMSYLYHYNSANRAGSHTPRRCSLLDSPEKPPYSLSSLGALVLGNNSRYSLLASPSSSHRQRQTQTQPQTPQAQPQQQQQQAFRSLTGAPAHAPHSPTGFVPLPMPVFLELSLSTPPPSIKYATPVAQRVPDGSTLGTDSFDALFHVVDAPPEEGDGRRVRRHLMSGAMPFSAHVTHTVVANSPMGFTIQSDTSPPQTPTLTFSVPTGRVGEGRDLSAPPCEGE